MKPSLKLLLSISVLAALFCGHAFATGKKPLQVFILAGQSNMQGHAKITTFEHIGMDPATKPMLAEMLGADGKPKACERVWISSIGCAGDDKTEQTGKLTAGFGATSEKIGPEFKGNVAAIRSEKYWDLELSGAKAKDDAIKQKAKKLAAESKMKPADEKAALEKMRLEGLNERERKILETGISNFEFHYLGSAKILGGVGKGLAEAMVELKNLK